MSYTKGPWELVNSFGIYTALGADSGDGVPADKDDGWHIANIGDCKTLVDGVGTELGYSVQTANARLICAAPELLEALIAMNAQLEAEGYMGTTYGPLRLAAETAIAKARGQL